MKHINLYDPNAITEVVVDVTQQKITSAEAGKAALAAIEGDQRTQAIIDAEAEVDQELEALQGLEDHDVVTIHLRTLTNATRLELSTSMAECEWSGSGFDELMDLAGAQIIKIDGFDDVIAEVGGVPEFLKRIKDVDIQRALVRAVSDHCTMPVGAAKN